VKFIKISYEVVSYMKAITNIDKNFSQWYTDVVTKSGLVNYSSVKGCVVICPYGYKVWELIQTILDKKIKAMGHENVYMPMFIPESLLNKEKEHVNGFAPEVAWVTHGGSEELSERLCVRPTSETLFCEYYSKVIKSYRDLPKLYNQWCSVVRWEKTTRPFLRGLEFLWQEGHTAHETFNEAEQESLKILDLYKIFCEEILAIPVIKGLKTEKEKFAGAFRTYTIESLMHDGHVLQSGTTHNFSDNFSKAFNIRYTDRNNNLQFVYQSSWGISTRLIGAIVMVHGDNNGLVLPPKIAPVQSMIIPIDLNDSKILGMCNKIKDDLIKRNIRADIDITDKTVGWKFSEHEMRGVPLRIEIGPKDIQHNVFTVVRRDTNEKFFVDLNTNFAQVVEEMLNDIQKELFNKAKSNMSNRIQSTNDFNEFKNIMNAQLGFIKVHWCGKLECELKIKEQTGATIRCINTEKNISDIRSKLCICCNEKANYEVYCAKAY
jgi:prolyl-tRNA synthetase